LCCGGNKGQFLEEREWRAGVVVTSRSGLRILEFLLGDFVPIKFFVGFGSFTVDVFGNAGIAKRNGHEKTAGAFSKWVPRNESVERWGVIRFNKMCEFVHKDVVKNPGWVCSEPIRDADLAS
jgi:hypothetical protein